MSKADDIFLSGEHAVRLRDYAKELEARLAELEGELQVEREVVRGVVSRAQEAERDRDEARRMVCRITRSNFGREYFDALVNAALRYAERNEAERHGWDPDVLFPRDGS